MPFVDKVGQSALECKIVQCNMEKVWKVWKAIDDGYWLVIIFKFCCIKRVFCIWLDFDYFDVSISNYLWHHLLALVVSTASLILADGAKQAGLVGCGGIYL